jgi:hypothetical protein
MNRGMRDVGRATRAFARAAFGNCRVAIVALVAGAAVGCTEVGTDPQAAVAIELRPSPVPAVVVGDTLRDSAGAVITLDARAINVNNEVIAGAPIRFIALDTGVVSIDSTSGVIVGKRVGSSQVIASIQGLQSERITVAVTLQPDTTYGLDTLRRTMQLSLTSPTAATSGPLRVFVGHDTVIAGIDTTIAVPSYLVRYAIVFPADGSVSDTDTTKVVLANDLGRPSTVDTTAASGIAARAVRISTAVSVIPDSVIVDAHVSHPDTTSVPGAPVRFVIRILRVN